MNETTATYEIPEGNLKRLQEKLAKLARRAVRLEVTPVVLTILGTKDVPVKDSQDHLTGEVDRFVIVQVTGSAPCVKGWTFVATLEHAGEAGNILRTVPGVTTTLPLRFRTASNFNCDHCGTTRARKDTFVVTNEAGEFKQIGRNCLADFLGGVDPQRVAGAATYLFGVDEICESESSGGGGGESRVDLGTFLGYVAAVVRVDGWRSRGAARAYNEAVEAGGGGRYISSSSDLACQTMFARTDKERAATRQYKPEPQDFETATLALTWLEETIGSKQEGLSDYEYNVTVIAKQAAITRKSLGLAASIVGIYKRSLEQAQERKVQAELGASSKHVGAIGERGLLYVTFNGLKTLQGQFGTTYLYKLITREGNFLTWFSSNQIEELKEGVKDLAVLATIKKHDNFKGVAQTIVSRVSVATPEQIVKAEKKAAKAAKQAEAGKAFEAKIQDQQKQDW